MPAVFASPRRPPVSNSNVHAFVEPTRTGYRLRLSTLKGDGLALNRMAGFSIAMGFIVGVAPLVSSHPMALPGALAIGSIGVGALAVNALRLPR
jgi:hypothetical protein